MEQQQEFINKSTQFVNNKIQELCYLYITERQKKNNELGCLIITFKKDNVQVAFVPLSNPNLSNELKNDVIEKTNTSKSNVIFFIVNEETQFSYCISKDLV